MPFIGIFMGFIVYAYFGAFIGRQVTHNDVAGIFPGIVAAIWVAWPFFRLSMINHRDLMHPKPRIYPGTPQDNFERLHKLLNEAVYFYGDRWHIISANTQSNRLVANLTYREEEAQWAGGNLNQHVWVRRFVKLEAYFKDSGDGGTIVQFDFEQRSEGMSGHVCDPIVMNVMEAFDESAGVGSSIGGFDEPILPAPPWWLLGLTSLSLLCFTWDVIRNTFGMS